jgi:hypothetical protein
MSWGDPLESAEEKWSLLDSEDAPFLLNKYGAWLIPTAFSSIHRIYNGLLWHFWQETVLKPMWCIVCQQPGTPETGRLAKDSQALFELISEFWN